MVYRNYPHHRPRPLIDLIPDHVNELDALDDEEDFHSRDDDFLVSARWQTVISRILNHLPRRVKRYSATMLVLALLFVLAWVIYFGPQYWAYRKEVKAMDTQPPMSYGSQIRPEFKAMIQISHMDARHLPNKRNRLIFVGDVHGCREELERLLEKVEFSQEHDHLVMVGDMISKGPDSAGVIKLARKLGASCVRGNWEDKLLLSIAEAQQRAGREASSAMDALDASTSDATTAARSDHKMRELAKTLTSSDIAFLQQCPVILRVGDVPHLGSLVVVHAGLVPEMRLDQQDPFHVMNMRTINLKTRIPSSTHNGGVPWEKFWNHKQKKLAESERLTVIYGHNRKRGLNVRKYSYGLDSGCVYGGELTALVVDGNGNTKVVHVKCNKKHGYDN